MFTAMTSFMWWIVRNKLYGKSRNGVSFDRLACNRQQETLFLMPYYRDGKGWLHHCFLSFGTCEKMGLRIVAIKVSRCQHGKKKKSPWLYSLEEFQGIPPRIFLAVPYSGKVGLRYEDCLSSTTADFYTRHAKDKNMQTKQNTQKQEPLLRKFE